VPGGSISGNIDADDGSVTESAIGPISGNVDAAQNATVSTYDALSGTVDADEGDATVYATGDISKAITAGQDLNLATAGSISADMTAGGSATVTSVGDLNGNVIATDGDANVLSYQDVEQNVTAGGNATVVAWVSDDGNVNAGLAASITAGDKVSSTVTTTTGNINISSNGNDTSNIVLSGGGTNTSSSIDTAGPLNLSGSTAGSLAVATQGDLGVSQLQSGGDLSLTADGTILGQAASTGGDVSATSTGAMSLDIGQAGNITVASLDNLSGAMNGSGTIDATAYGKAVGLNLTGGGDVSLLSIGTSNANLSSSNGSITAIAGDVASYPLVSAPNGDVSITTLSSLSVPSLNAGGDVNIVSGGDLGGYIASGGDSTVVSLGTLSADVSAGGDASLFGMTGVTGIDSADNDLQAISYGNLGASNSSFHAGHDLTELWTTGDMAGTFTADHAIESVSAYGTIDGTFTAGTITGAQDSAYGQIGSITAWGNIAGSITAAQVRFLYDDVESPRRVWNHGRHDSRFAPVSGRAIGTHRRMAGTTEPTQGPTDRIGVGGRRDLGIAGSIVTIRYARHDIVADNPGR
jgi:hypothetical protein